VSEPLDALLARLATTGAAAWPTLQLDGATFLHYLRERAGALPLKQVAMLHVTDLYLACCCVSRADGAVEKFHDEYLVPLAESLERIRIPISLAREVQGILFERLVTPGKGDASAPTLLSGYAGTGELRSWVHVVAAREAFGLLRKASRDAQAPKRLLEAVPVIADDPDLRYLSTKYHSEIEACFTEAAAALTAAERNALRYRFIDGLSVEQIGAIYRIHRATAARRVLAAQERLAQEIKARLMVRLQLDARELDSVLRAIHSRLEFSIGRHLAPASESE
jgi:RNA polymerase sigma-70 factor, ECF subfamily